ncbi:hypothetical protein FRC18_007228, partial [Serendipita sp. 400]
NRIAQREFRLRKQQRIRDLELRVELLSASKDDAFKSMDGVMQDLVRENQALRQLVRDLSSFIGEGVGGFLPKLGWDISSFEEFKSRTETDTMNEAYAARKKNPNVPAPVVPVLSGQKRKNEESTSSARKKSKPNEDPEASTSAFGISSNHSNIPLPQNNSPLQPSPSQHIGDSIGNVQQDYVSHSNSVNHKPYLSVPISPAQPGPAFPSNRALPPPPAIPSTTSSGIDQYNPKHTTPSPAVGSYQFPTVSVASEGSATPSLSTSNSHSDDPWHAQKDEAGRLVHYHLTNFKRNPTYRLPASLRPTQVQRTVAHEFIIDGIPIPDVRDKMILLKDTFDLAEGIHILFSTAKIHSDDLLVYTNWELSEEWFTRFGFLATPAVLEITNKWRRERKEPEIPSSVLESEESRYETSGAQ